MNGFGGGVVVPRGMGRASCASFMLLSMVMGASAGSLFPPSLYGEWESEREHCEQPEMKRTTGTLLSIRRTDDLNGPIATMAFTSYEAGEGDFCKVSSAVASGIGVQIAAGCQTEESPTVQMSFHIEISPFSNYLRINEIGSTELNTYYRCELDYTRDAIERVKILTKGVNKAKQLQDACANTYEKAPDVSNDEAFFNIIACETSLQYAFDFASFIYELSGRKTKKVCWKEPMNRRTRVEKFLAFLEKIGDLKEYSSASVLYTFASETYACK